MNRESLFKTPIEVEQEKKERLLKEGGIYYFEKEDPETRKMYGYVNVMGIEVETEASREDIEAIKKELVLSELDQQLLRIMAETYSLRQPLMIEGAPAAGKTFLIKYFTKLLYGRKAEPLAIYGTTRTDEEHILGRWIPRTDNERDKKLWQDFLDSATGQQKMAEVVLELKEKKDLTEAQRQNILREKLRELAVSVGLVHLSEFEFNEGPLLKAYSAYEGAGYILDVEELGVIPTNVQETFLPIGGEDGKLADIIQFWGNGREIYRRGKKTWIVFGTNPPEEVGARHVVTTPLASRLTWFRIEKEKIAPKVENLIDYFYTKGAVREEIKPEVVLVPLETPIDFRQYPELAKAIALAVKTFHTQFTKWYDKVGEPDREQKFELGAREVLRVLDHLLTFQSRDKEGNVDLISSIKRAIELYYISRLADKKEKEKISKRLNEILSGTTSPGYKIYQKSLQEKIQEEIRNLDPETQRRSILQELEKIEAAAYQIPEAHKGWVEIRDLIAQYFKGLSEVQELKSRGQAEKDLKKGAEFLTQSKSRLEQLQEIGKVIAEKIKQKEDLEKIFEI